MAPYGNYTTNEVYYKDMGQKTNKKRPLTFFWVGVILAAVNFLIYLVLTHTFFRNELPVASAIAYVLSAAVAYVMHKSITWKDRPPSRSAVIKFIMANLVVGFVITPLLTWFFMWLTGIYEFAFAISSFLHLPFSLDFITKVGVWGFTNAVSMIINYVVYNKIVFREEK
jgi:putative flippase GtrA